MNIAEHKLGLFRQIDELPKESLIELEKIILTLKVNKSSVSNDIKVESYHKQQAEELKSLWQEGIESGGSKPLDMEAIREESLRRYKEVNQ